MRCSSIGCGIADPTTRGSLPGETFFFASFSFGVLFDLVATGMLLPRPLAPLRLPYGRSGLLPVLCRREPSHHAYAQDHDTTPTIIEVPPRRAHGAIRPRLP